MDGDRDVADLPVHLPVDAAIPIVKVRLVKAVGRWEGIEMKRRGSLLASESAFLRVGLKGNQPHLVAEMCPMRLDSPKAPASTTQRGSASKARWLTRCWVNQGTLFVGKSDISSA